MVAHSSETDFGCFFRCCDEHSLKNEKAFSDHCPSVQLFRRFSEVKFRKGENFIDVNFVFRRMAKFG